MKSEPRSLEFQLAPANRKRNSFEMYNLKERDKKGKIRERERGERERRERFAREICERENREEEVSEAAITIIIPDKGQRTICGVSYTSTVANRKISSYLVHLSLLRVSYMSAAFLESTKGTRSQIGADCMDANVDVASQRDIKRLNFGIAEYESICRMPSVAQSSDAREEREIN